jgi:hypothetical protein
MNKYDIALILGDGIGKNFPITSAQPCVGH